MCMLSGLQSSIMAKQPMDGPVVAVALPAISVPHSAKEVGDMNQKFKIGYADGLAVSRRCKST